jgi:GNAT superfamily N-acetyltransferase
MSSTNEPFIFSDALSAEDEEALSQRLWAFNLAHAGASWTTPAAPQPVQVSVRDAAGRLIGGLVGTTHAIPYWLNVSVVWVDETARLRGVGSELMRRAEDIARQQGCRFARLATSH